MTKYFYSVSVVLTSEFIASVITFIVQLVHYGINLTSLYDTKYNLKCVI